MRAGERTLHLFSCSTQEIGPHTFQEVHVSHTEAMNIGELALTLDLPCSGMNKGEIPSPLFTSEHLQQE